MSKKKEIDDVTGVETTGHEWDGVKELNKPLPQWWLWSFYASIVWAIGYMIVYPAWPLANDYTRGIWNFSQRTAVALELKAGLDAQAALRRTLEQTALVDVRKDPELLRFASAAGSASFQTNCAPCHGRGAQGFVGYPNLNDDDWLWGGAIDEIYTTIAHGIRSEDGRARLSQMPRYGIENQLSKLQIDDVAEYVLSLSGKSTDAAAVDRGAQIFKENERCTLCHGNDGKGKLEQGAPNLTDGIWLWGGRKDQVVESIRTGRGGMMPAWQPRLDGATLKSLAVYVHSLGGGQ